MFPRILSNCHEDVDEFLLTISTFSEAAHTQLNPSNPHTLEYPQEALNMLTEGNFVPSGQFSVVDAEIIAYVSGYIFRKAREKFCTVSQR